MTLQKGWKAKRDQFLKRQSVTQTRYEIRAERARLMEQGYVAQATEETKAAEEVVEAEKAALELTKNTGEKKSRRKAAHTNDGFEIEE